MAIGHALRGAASAALALIALEAVGSDRTGKVGSFFADVNTLVSHALSPDVPLIPDRRTGGGDAGGSSYMTPAQAAAAAKTADRAGPASAAVGALTGSGGALSNLPSLNQYVAGGGLSGLQNIDPNLTPTYPAGG